MGPSDLREFSRIGIDLWVVLACGDGTSVEGPSCDLALKGVRCQTSARPALGTRCSVTMLFGDRATGLLELAAEGRVVRHDSDGVAVEFTSLELDTFDHLRNLILAHAIDSDSVREEFERHLGLKPRPETAS